MENIQLNFQHHQAAHCETGAVSSLFKFYGLDISEPMAFGLASGLSFAYLPFIKINGLPLMAYRMPPRFILRMISWRVKGLKVKFKKFKSQQKAQDFLDEKLAQGKPIGLQTSVYFLPYFPKEMRFHFNAHNLIVFGRETQDAENNYLISDPVFANPVSAKDADLTKARFAKGSLAPKGLAYWFEEVPASIDYKTLIPKAIRLTGRMNGKKNFTLIAGVNGMLRVAKRIEKLDKDSPRYAQLFLGHIVRMQEEIGTGGAGFRYIYGAFLQESAVKLDDARLLGFAERFIEIGDEWREFALLCARINKNRGEQTFKDVACKLRGIAEMESQIYDEMARYKLIN